LLALVIVLTTIPAVRDDATGLVSRLLPSPTPTLVPGSDLFYLLPNPPGVVVSLDGHTLARLPPPGDPHPLRLALGHHVFAWRSRIFSFLPLRCTVSLPPVRPAGPDTCPFLSAQQVPLAERAAPGRVIALHVTLDSLSVDAHGQLASAVQGALDSIRHTTLVQPGERYFYYAQPGGSPGGPVVAAQPLRVTLSYGFVNIAGYPEPCAFGELPFPCRFPGQDCTQLCTLAQPPSAIADEPGLWIAGALVSSTWDYTTLGGQAVASNIGDAFDIQVALLRITWDGATWHVTPLLGYIPGLPVTGDLVCDPARYWLEQNGRWAFMLTNPPSGAQAQFVSDPTTTDGCLVVLDPHPGSDVPAVFLERFGVLLAVNDTANSLGANLPMADSAEQSLAHRLAAQAQLTF
jgi:hypothetical protein